MRTRTALVAMAMVFGLGWSANRVFSQDGGMEGKKPEAKKEEAPPGGMTPEEVAAMEKAMAPGEPHKVMASHEGNWVSAGRMWMAPDKPPMEFKGTAKFRMIFGGRYQIQEVASEMMGMPFEGMGLSGYDNIKKKYFSTWVDSMGTGIMTCEGTADDKGTITQTGMMMDPATGIDCKVRMVFPAGDKDSLFFEMFVDRGQGEVKCMDMKYTRVKDKK